MRMCPASPTRSADDQGAETWPPLEFWDSVRRVGRETYLELGRQVGVPGETTPRLEARPEPIASSSLDDAGPRTLGSDASPPTRRESRSAQRAESERAVALEQPAPERPIRRAASEGGDLQRLASALDRNIPAPANLGLFEPFVYGNDQGEFAERNTPTDAADAVDDPDAAADASSDEAPATPVATALAESDRQLFETYFDLHPFATAAFLRAFIACSFCLLLFHIHSLLTWPDELGPGDASGDAKWGNGALARSWLLTQVVVLTVSIPLRMEVQRALFRVSTARDTQEATRKLRNVLSSSTWRANRQLGRVLLLLMLCGPVLLRGPPGLLGCWGLPGGLEGLGLVQLQLVSVNSSNLLVAMLRTVLVLSLLYFVQVAAPRQTEGSPSRGLSATTIKRLKRLTFSSAAQAASPDSLTQCSVCLEHYEEGDKLLVLPCDDRHNFHEACIRPWLQRTNTCPLCQRNVPEDPRQVGAS